MPSYQFEKLNSEKKQKIISAGIAEFGKFGYLDGSTNKIVENSGISKGSLFKYFENKEELYFYCLECATKEFIASMEKIKDGLPSDLFSRVIQYSESELSWYIQNPDKYKLIIKAFRKSDTEIYRKTEARYNLASQEIYDRLLAGVDASQFRWNRQKTSSMLKWFLQGFNEDFLNKAEAEYDTATEIDRIKNEYVQCLTDYMEILRNGLMQ